MRVGNSQMLPMPTAEPMQARMKPLRLRKLSRELAGAFDDGRSLWDMEFLS
jgi:hypothetical protein